MTPYQQQQAQKILSTYSSAIFAKAAEDALKKAQELSESPKFRKVMSEWKEGTLTSSSGEKVTDQKQALAIAFSEAREVEKGKDLGGEMVKGGLGSGRKSGTFKVGDKIKFHPHTSLKASKDGKGTGYAKHEGKITHAYPDGHYDVEDNKGFIARHHPEKNNFEKGEDFTDFVGGETEKKYHKNFQKEDPKNPDEEDSNKVVKSEDNFEVEEVINLLNKSLFEEIDLEKGGEGSRGGKVIGHTKSGKPIYADKSIHGDPIKIGSFDSTGEKFKTANGWEDVKSIARETVKRFTHVDGGWGNDKEGVEITKLYTSGKISAKEYIQKVVDMDEKR